MIDKLRMNIPEGFEGDIDQLANKINELIDEIDEVKRIGIDRKRYGVYLMKELKHPLSDTLRRLDIIEKMFQQTYQGEEAYTNLVEMKRLCIGEILKYYRVNAIIKGVDILCGVSYETMVQKEIEKRNNVVKKEGEK